MNDSRPQLLVEHAAIFVVHAEAPLGGDDFALGLNFLGIEAQIPNAIGFDVENQRQRRARKPILIHRDVLRVVYALFEPPFASITLSSSPGPYFLAPLNIMCSKKCEMPVVPGRSLRDPMR